MSNEAYLVQEQRPRDGQGFRSPLAQVGLHPLPGPAPVHIQEDADKGQLLLRGQADDQTLAQQIVALGLQLPTTPLTASAAGQRAIRWLSPDEWLLTLPVADTHATETQLRAALSDDCAVVNISAAQAILILTGAKAEELLRKSSPYDFHPSNFPVGKVVTTCLAQSQASIRRLAATQFELVIRRSYTPYLCLWLADAAAEYGLEVG